MIITKDFVREILEYNPDTGIFTWNARGRHLFKSDGEMKRWNNRYAGKKAGSLGRQGYIESLIFKKNVAYHRLAWLHFYGEYPECVDHINGNRSDNRIINLRSVSKYENSKNRRIYGNNKIGVMGVIFCKLTKKWLAYISHDKKRIYLGRHESLDSAIKARAEAEIKYNFHPNHGLTFSEAEDNQLCQVQ